MSFIKILARYRYTRIKYRSTCKYRQTFLVYAAIISMEEKNLQNAKCKSSNPRLEPLITHPQIIHATPSWKEYVFWAYIALLIFCSIFLTVKCWGKIFPLLMCFYQLNLNDHYKFQRFHILYNARRISWDHPLIRLSWPLERSSGRRWGQLWGPAQDSSPESQTRPPAPTQQLVFKQGNVRMGSVADPDPYLMGLEDPHPDLLVTSTLGSRAFHLQAKIVRKALISTVLWLFYDFIFEVWCKCVSAATYVS